MSDVSPTSRERMISQMPVNNARTKSKLQEQTEAALADAKNHLELIPRTNKLALKLQQQIIAGWEKRLQEMGGDSWLT